MSRLADLSSQQCLPPIAGVLACLAAADVQRAFASYAGGLIWKGPVVRNDPDIAIDLTRIERWLLDNGVLQHAGLDSVTQLAGGTQNIVLRFRSADRDLILRHPPAVPRQNSNKLLAREIRVLGALSGTSVPHPAVIAACTDPDVTGGIFYIMEAIEGFNPTVAMPTAVSANAEIRHRIGIEMIDALAALAQVDLIAADLEDFGKIDGFLERQVSRWAAELEGYARFDGWQGPAALGDVASVGRWLADNLPPDLMPGIIHGDYHIGNALFDEEGRLRAIVDWEMATLGDPLVDLGRLLVSWPEDGATKPHTMRVTPLNGFPSHAEMIARYADQTGRSLIHLPWFEVLACYKLSLILEGTHARAQSGLADLVTGKRLHQSAVALLSQAGEIIARH